MNDKDFAELVESVKQAGEIKRGLRQPSRVFDFSPMDIKGIRAKLDKSQREFALMIGVSLGTLQNWEQGRRKPVGPARALLRVAEQSPEAFRDALETPQPLTLLLLHPDYPLPRNLKVIQIAGDAGVGEDGAGLLADFALGRAAREVGQDEVFHVRVAGQRRRAGRGHVAELGRHLALFFQISALHHQRVGPADDVGQAVGAADVADVDVLRAGDGLAQHVVGVDDAAVG